MFSTIFANMQAILEKVGKNPAASFQIERNEVPYFISPWHFHPEIEIILIIDGFGTLFAGDAVMPFSSGALAIIGPNLPHVWMSDKKYYEGIPGLMAKSLVIKFSSHFLGEAFLQSPEMAAVRQLFQKASRGLLFNGVTKEKAEQLMLRIDNTGGMSGILVLLELLNLLSLSQEYTFLSSQVFSLHFSKADNDRIDKVYKFIITNYSRDIKLSEVAALANMNEAAFCRYFKSRTLKTFSDFVNELRIGNACKLLIEKRISISEVCYQSGYNHLSNFYKQFRRIKNCTPQQFIEEFKAI